MKKRKNIVLADVSLLAKTRRVGENPARCNIIYMSPVIRVLVMLIDARKWPMMCHF